MEYMTWYSEQEPTENTSYFRKKGSCAEKNSWDER